MIDYTELPKKVFAALLYVLVPLDLPVRALAFPLLQTPPALLRKFLSLISIATQTSSPDSLV